MAQLKKRMQPVVALQAIRRLLKNPDATEEVFVVIRALAGDAIERGYARFIKTQHAQTILNQDTPLLDTLSNREMLRGLPDNSVGRAYLAFMEAGNITAEGLQQASESEEDETIDDPRLQTYALRLRDQHDLWHVLSGFGRDVAGEACLLAFTYAQTKNRGIGFIAFVGALKLRKTFGSAMLSSMRQAYQMRRRAAWMPGQLWEVQLARPLEEVRRELGLQTPVRYESLPLEMVAA